MQAKQFEELVKAKPEYKHIIGKIPEDIKKHCQISSFKAKQLIIHKGEAVEYVDILIDGRVQVLNEFENGNIYCFAFITPIAYIGSLEVMAKEQVYTSTVEAQTPCTMIRLPREAFISWIQRDHSFTIEIAGFIARILLEQSWRNGEAAVYPALYVVGSYFVKAFEAEGREELNLTKARQQIANELGYSVRTINRNIKILKEEKLITVVRDRFRLTREQYKALIKSLKEIKQNI